MKAAILVAQDVQDEEYLYPYYRLQEYGADLDVILSPSKTGSNPTGKYGIPLKWNISSMEADLANKTYDVIVIPGGWCPEILRLDKHIINIIRKHDSCGCVIGAICHGPQVLLSAKLHGLQGCVLSGYQGICDDITNAGYVYSPDLVVQYDGHLLTIVTAPHYKDNPQFMKTILHEYESRLNS